MQLCSLCSVSLLLSVKNRMEGTSNMPDKKCLFFRDYWTKSDGDFAEMQIISYIIITRKHTQINLQFWKLLVLEVRLYYYFLDKQYIFPFQLGSGLWFTMW